MSLLKTCIALTLLYAGAVWFLLWEWRHTTPQQRRENRSIPLICSSTILYVVVIYKLVTFTYQGVLPLT